MKAQLRKLVKNIRRIPGKTAVDLFNSAVLGFQEYYNSATHGTLDFTWLGYILERRIYNRLKGLFSKEGKLPEVFKHKYRRPSSAAQARFIAGIPLFPIADIRHQSPMCFSQDHTPYTESGRKKIHTCLNGMIQNGLESLSDNPVIYESTEYNDNRISRWI